MSDDSNGDWSETFLLTEAMQQPARLTAAIETALKACGLQPGLAVMNPDLDLTQGVLLDLGEEMHEVKVALPRTRGELHIFEHDGRPILEFSGSNVTGDDEDDELAEAIADELSDFAPSAVRVTKLEPLEEPRASISVERDSNDLIITVGLGPRALRYRSEGGAGLGDDDLVQIGLQLTEATDELVADARRTALAETPLPVDRARAGRWFIDVYGPDGDARWSEALTETNLEALLERANQGGAGVVTRYLSDGRPFFRTPVDETSEASFDDLHLFRTWSWLLR